MVTQPHAAEPERGYLQPAQPQHPLPHGSFHAFNCTTVHALQ
jgi:hypothetical protein